MFRFIFQMAVLLCVIQAITTIVEAQKVSSVVTDLDKERFPQSWIHAGPIRTIPLSQRNEDGSSMSAFHTDFLGGEASAQLIAGQQLILSNGQKVIPRQLNRVNKGWNKGSVGGRSSPGTAHYFYCELKVNADQVRYLYADFEGSPKVWINGQLVLSNWRDEHILRPRDYGVRVNLKKGINRCLVKLDSKQVWWLARLEFMTRSQYLKEIVPNVKGLKVNALSPESMVIETNPITFDPLYTWTARIKELNGEVVGMASGKNTELSHVFSKPDKPLTRGRVYKIEIDVAPIDETTMPLDQLSVFAISGESSEVLKFIRENLAQAKVKSTQLAAPWPQAYEIAFSWFDRLIQSKGLEKSQASLEQLYYAQMMIEGLLNGKNPLAAIKGARIPVWFEWTDSKGKRHAGNYGITLPVNYGANEELAPILYTLRGGSFRNKVVELKLSGSAQDPARYEVDRSLVLDDKWFTVIPANLDGRWGVEMLEAIHAHIEEHFIHDKKRIYVLGGSLGGFGAWNWVGHRPNRFAAAVPRSGIGDIYLSPRMTEVPIWVICGGKDRLVVSVEKGVDRVQRLGGILRYTMLPHNGHGGGRDRVEQEELRDWLFKHQLPDQKRKEVDLKDFYKLNQNGYGEVKLLEIDGSLELQMPMSSTEWGKLPSERGARRSSYTLQKPYRPSGRIVGQSTLIHKDSNGKLKLCLPVDAGIDPVNITGDISLNHMPPYKCLSVMLYTPVYDYQYIKKRILEKADQLGLSVTGDERLLMHSPFKVTENNYFLELRVIVKK